MTEWLEIFEEMERDFFKKTKNFSLDKRSLMFCSAKRSDGRILLVKCSNKLNAVGNLEILKNHEEKTHFMDFIFEHDNAPVQKSKIIGIFFQENEWKNLEWLPFNPDLNTIEILFAILKQRLLKHTVLWENLEEKCMKSWTTLTQTSWETFMKTTQTVY